MPRRTDANRAGPGKEPSSAPARRASARGLKRIFECTGCGKCCTGDPEEYEVRATRAEQDAIAAHLGLSLERFRERYAVGRSLSMAGGKCAFLRPNRRCAIYPVRPRQCRTYPFWPELRTDKAWKEEAAVCEGIRLPLEIASPRRPAGAKTARPRTTRRRSGR